MMPKERPTVAAPTYVGLQDDETSREEAMEEDRQAGPIQRPMKKTNYRRPVHCTRNRERNPKDESGPMAARDGSQECNESAGRH